MYDLPEACSPSSIEFATNDVIGTTTSIYTGAQQVFSYPGSWWTATITLPPMSRKDAGLWQAWFCKIRGSWGTFALPVYYKKQGFYQGGGLVNGASQTGTALVTDGWKANTQILSAGDYLTVGTNLLQATDDTYSDSSGNANIPVYPLLRGPDDNAEVEITSPWGEFRLATNSINWKLENLITSGITFTAREVI